MSGTGERSYLSIGEVLGLLLEEFPDVTISKIRFLESQGLIEPERTASGYRKFYDADIERLRTILREQRENHLPLRVIRDRLDPAAAGPTAAAAAARPAAPAAPAVEDSGALVRPLRERSGAPAVPLGDMPVTVDDDTGGIVLDDPTGTISPFADQVETARHPAARSASAAGSGAPSRGGSDGTPGRPATVTELPSAGRSGRSVGADPGDQAVDEQPLTRAELCARCGLSAQQVDELREYGVIGGQGSGSHSTFSALDLRVAEVAAAVLARGFEPRHLRTWRQAAEREVGVLEQRYLPLLRQRNPQARAEAQRELVELVEVSGELRQAIITALLDPYLQG